MGGVEDQLGEQDLVASLVYLLKHRLVNIHDAITGSRVVVVLPRTDTWPNGVD